MVVGCLDGGDLRFDGVRALRNFAKVDRVTRDSRWIIFLTVNKDYWNPFDFVYSKIHRLAIYD